MMKAQHQIDEKFMLLAYKEALKAKIKEEVPVGCVMVDQEGNVLSKSHNLREKLKHPLSHAEILAINKTCKKIKAWRLENITLYVTLEPCLMCLSALYQSRIKRIVFGAYDAKGGALSLGYFINRDIRLNHRFQISGGILETQNANLLTDFFRKKRKEKKMKTHMNL